MEEWKEYRLGDIIAIKSGFAYKGDMIGYGENILLGMGCVSYKERFLLSGARSYAGDCADRYCANSGDIVLATRQQSDNLPILGMPAIIPNELSEKRIIIGANLYRVDNESDFSNQYIYWLLKTPLYVNHIRSCQSGTTVRMITKANIEDFRFKAPGRRERDRISTFLKTLDDKIEANRRINDNLEQQAQALFKSWFVDFEPFRDQPFVESELGMIPERWKVGTLGEIMNITSGKRPPKKETKPIEDFIVPLIGASGIMGYTNSVLFNEKILVIGRVGTHGVVQRFNTPCWPSDNTLVIKSCFYEYCYQILCSIDYTSLNRGSTQPLITQTDIKNQLIVIPPIEVINNFEVIVSTLMNLEIINVEESRRLAELRDTLLPRLMSGEIKVGDVTL